jgi:diacylglycerol kinase family enzyme
MTRRRVAAASALALGPAALVLALAAAVASFPGGLIAFAGVALVLAAAAYGAVRRGAARALALGAAVLGAALTVVLVVSLQPVLVLLAVACLWLSLAAMRTAFRPHVPLPRVAPPGHPVLFYNPNSGGGKAERLHLADEARARGIEPIELTRGADLETLVRAAVAAGADGLAMAGGDGSQAVVATVAAERGLPYACVPAGTRNHFALDLGVDRDDAVGALDAFVDGGERVVDLAEINGRVFVNNVSLGLYAEAVQRAGYRDAKLRTLVDTLPDTLGPDGGLDLRWRGPDGDEHTEAAAVLVSNNRYRLGRAAGSGTRPRIDDGLLGVTVLGVSGSPRRLCLRAWSAPSFEVESERPLPAGIDGEAARLEPPLRFRIRPAALRVRIARAHPGASPSAFEPDDPWEIPHALASIAAGEPSEPPRRRLTPAT